MIVYRVLGQTPFREQFPVANGMCSDLYHRISCEQRIAVPSVKRPVVLRGSPQNDRVGLMGICGRITRGVRTAVEVVGDVVRDDSPLGEYGNVRMRTRGYASDRIALELRIAEPTSERVSGSGRICEGYCFRFDVEVCGVGLGVSSAVEVVGDLVCDDSPLGEYGNVRMGTRGYTGDSIALELRIAEPASERVPRLGRVVELYVLRFDCEAIGIDAVGPFIEVVCYTVRNRRPLCNQGDVAYDLGIEVELVFFQRPVHERVSSTGHLHDRFRNGFQIDYGSGVDGRGSAVGVECNGVTDRCPLRVQRNGCDRFVAVGHHRYTIRSLQSRVRVPSREGIVIPYRIGNGSRFSRYTVIIRLSVTAVYHECESVSAHQELVIHLLEDVSR